jgi:ribosomal protein S18 acetylase RimI-like enzyme
MSRPDVTELPALEGSLLLSMSSLIAEAIEDDPYCKWRVPNDRIRVARLRQDLELHIDHGLNGSGLPFTVRHAGIAFWSPPMTRAPSTLRSRVTSAFARATGAHPIRARRLNRSVRTHQPEQPHWRLDFVAVDPGQRRLGIGRSLVQVGLDRADAEQVGAFTTTTDPRSLPFFMAMGFEKAGSVELPTAPTISLLWRPPPAQYSD